MTDRLVDRTLRAFSEELASDRPVPGGGSASAYAGALGAALAAMVARLAAKKAPGEHDAFIAEVEGLREELLRLVDADSAAYARVASAMKLPRSTEQEKSDRTARVQECLLEAARVPLEIALSARRLLEACEEGMAFAPPAAASDIGVAALMADAALHGARLNVLITLASLKDDQQVKALSEELASALDGSHERRARILERVGSGIGG